MFEITIYLKS